MWSGEIKKISVYIGIVLFLASLVMAGYSYQTKEITFIHNGQQQQVSTIKNTVGQFIASQDIKLSAHDQVKPDPDQTIEEGMTIELEEKWPVILYDGETKKTIYTSQTVVKKILAEQNIRLAENDSVEPAPGEEISEEEEIRITRITKKLVEEEKPVVYRMVKKADYTLANGQTQTVQKGDNGLALYRYEVTYRNGKEVNRQLINAKIIKEKQDHIVSVGTLGTVSRGGKDFSPRRVLNMELTAYGPGYEHTGKTPEHPEYGITRTGTRATENRTIAVDPNVIPLGWWVYIEGFGFRKAEDTGSAVKGDRIDIYYEDDQYANGFGLKKGYTVYVIGPEKP